jgi:hypothetical protein
MSEGERDEAYLDALLGAAATDLAADGRSRAGDDALIARGIDGAIARTKARATRGASRRKRSAHAVVLLAAILVAATGAFGWIEHARTTRGGVPGDRGAKGDATPGECVDSRHGPDCAGGGGFERGDSGAVFEFYARGAVFRAHRIRALRESERYAPPWGRRRGGATI